MVISKFAANQLKEISKFYSERGSKSYVKKIQKQFLDLIKQLKVNPNLGQKQTVIINSSFEYRYLLVNKSYKVIYRQTNKTIYVVDFFDTRQKPLKIGRNF